MALRPDRAEFGRLFEVAARRLWIVASATAPPGQVDDVLQEAALTGLRRFTSFERGTDFGAWMAQIVRNVSHGQTRRQAGHRGRISVDEISEDLVSPPEAGQSALTLSGDLKGDQAEFEDRLDAALRALTPNARACLLLHVIDGMSQGEVASLLGLAEGTVASHVHRARATLREALNSRPQSASQEVSDESRELTR